MHRWNATCKPAGRGTNNNLTQHAELNAGEPQEFLRLTVYMPTAPAANNVNDRHRQYDMNRAQTKAA